METLKFTVRLIKKRPLRSLLTIIQIALGVWVVTTILTANFQANDQTNAILDKYGNNLAKIRMQKTEVVDGQTRYSSRNDFTLEDVKTLENESNNIEAAFIFENLWNVKLQSSGLTYELRGAAETTAEAVTAMGLNLVAGSFFTPQDVTDNNPVVIISQTISDQLFPTDSAIGKKIALEAQYYNGEYIDFEVIGVYEPISPILQDFFQESTMLIPIGSRKKSAETDIVFGQQSFSNIFIKSTPNAIYDAVADSQNILKRDDGYIPVGQYLQDSTRMYMSAINGISLALGAFAFIAIIISSLGILSTMLVNVVERTREIGLRKALGATKFSIVLQILNESLVLAFLGSLLGIVAANFTGQWLSNKLLGQMMFMQTELFSGFHPLAALTACLMALLMGMVFALYPAIQAARTPAVTALRDN